MMADQMRPWWIVSNLAKVRGSSLDPFIFRHASAVRLPGGRRGQPR